MSGFEFDLWALAFAALVAGTIWLVLFLINRSIDRPYDWSKDGECNNASKVRIVRDMEWRGRWK